MATTLFHLFTWILRTGHIPHWASFVTQLVMWSLWFLRIIFLLFYYPILWPIQAFVWIFYFYKWVIFGHEKSNDWLHKAKASSSSNYGWIPVRQQRRAYRRMKVGRGITVPKRISRHHRRKGTSPFRAYASKLNIFTAYRLTSWWTSFFGHKHIQEDDVDCAHILSQASWHSHLVFSPPYEYILKRDIEPPDGIVGDSLALSLVLSLLALTCLERLIKLLAVKAGWYQLPPAPVHRERDKGTYKIGTRRRNNSSRRTYVFASRVVSIHSSQFNQDAYSFDSDGATAVVDNSANACICKDKHMYVGEIKPLSTRERTVATIGGTDHSPSGIGTVRWTWSDNEGTKHTYLIPNVLFFPDSPVNILSVSALAHFFDGDEEGTSITSKMKYSEFTWDHGQYTRTFDHSGSLLPELPINTGYTLFKSFCNWLSQSVDDTVSHVHCSTMQPPSLDTMEKEVYFEDSPDPDRFTSNVVTDDEADDSDSDDESLFHSVVEDPVPAASNNPLPPPEPPPAAWRDSNPGSPEIEHFHIGQRARYTRDGDTQLIEIVGIDTTAEATKFRVKCSNGQKFTTTREYIAHLDDPDIASIPISTSDYKRESQHLSEQDLSRLARPSPLSPIQQEFLSWHYRLHHLSPTIMFRLAKLGILPRRLLVLKGDGSGRKNHCPMCASCSYGTVHRKAWRSKGKLSGSIRKDTDTRPGKGTSTDQLVSAQPGLVPQFSGHLTRQRIWAASIFVDHFSRFVFVHLLRSTSQEETLNAKQAYEKFAADCGVTIERYHADNGRFAEKDFREAVEDANQSITYCAVGAHHQNGIAENHIKMLTLSARTVLLHAKRYWPEAITTMLWPFALKAAAEKHNIFGVDEAGISPQEKFTGVHTDLPIEYQRVWGCPVYVLDSRLQDRSGGLPKWEPRSRLGIYLGHSPSHAGSVALVLNPRTGHVSPQYHVVFDNEFTTVPHMRAGTIPDNWRDLVERSSELATPEKFDLANTWFDQQEDTGPSTSSSSPLLSEGGPAAPVIAPSEGAVPVSEGAVPVSEGATSVSEGAPAPATDATGSPTLRVRFSPDTLPFQPYSRPGPETRTMHPSRGTVPAPPSPVHEGDALRMPAMLDLATAGLRRSSRSQTPSQAARESTDGTVRKMFGLFAIFSTVAIGTIAATSEAISAPKTTWSKTVAHYEQVNTLFDGTINSVHASVFAANQEQNETYTFKEMLRQDDKKDFIMAMLKEVEDHETRDHWTLMQRKDVPKAHLVNGKLKSILSIWSFKRKRFPDGRIMKYKARLCAHGGMQQWGVNYWETYAPVVNWISVRTLLVVASILDLPSRSIDFVLAFPQADLDVDVYMEIPIGMDVDGVPHSRSCYILKLNKSLYGLKQASANWFEHLKTGLEARGFAQSNIDPCVFYRSDCIILCYVDDCVLVSPEESVINELIHSLQNGPERYILTDEGDIQNYLGVELKRNDDGSFEMKQSFLIEKIVNFLGVTDDMNTRETPVGKPLLHKDIDGPARRNSWNYRAAVGMLNYLQNSTRPELAMAVHQCARFCSDPKLSHERAMKRIGRYLKGTSERGVIYRPDPTKGIECFVDADFAGGWAQADADSAENVLSRTGFVICYAGCPVLWSSKLQTEIALSTTEAEYIALSTAMRDVIPFMYLLSEISSVLPIEMPTPEVRCKVFEDNSSCISVATSKKFTPRTKHIAIKYHHFRHLVHRGIVEILPIKTQEQTADIFTKPLSEDLFLYLRKKLNGW